MGRLRTRVEKYRRDGKDVTAISSVVGMHRAHSLCFSNCRYYDYNDPSKQCSIAQKLYKFCFVNGLIAPVYECPKFERSE